VRALALAVAVLALAGCGKKEPPPDLVKRERQVMEKAKGVGEVLQKSADERRDQADRQK